MLWQTRTRPKYTLFQEAVDFFRDDKVVIPLENGWSFFATLPGVLIRVWWRLHRFC